jgi:hypothetical protein
VQLYTDWPFLDRSGAFPTGCFWRILLQKSKLHQSEFFGETLKREAIDDSDNLSRVSEVAYEFSVGR